MDLPELVDGGVIDRCLSLQPGTADRLARRSKLPHVRLPDGTIRFSVADVVESLQSRGLHIDCSARGKAVQP